MSQPALPLSGGDQVCGGVLGCQAGMGHLAQVSQSRDNVFGGGSAPGQLAPITGNPCSGLQVPLQVGLSGG